MRYPFLQRHYASGRMWTAGNTILGLCAAYNHATDPALYMSDREHARARQYARAIRHRMDRLAFAYGADWKELSNGTLWPVTRRRSA